MSDSSGGLDIAQRRQRLLVSVREEFSLLAGSADGVRSLARWFQWLKPQISQETSIGTSVLETLRSTTNNPVEWCATENLALPTALSADLIRQRSDEVPKFDPSSLTLYMFGRAAMESVISEPSGTAGLTRAYEWLQGIDGGYLSYPGAEDRLLEADTLSESVVQELRNEARRLAEEPHRATKPYDRARSSDAIRRAIEIKSLEAAVAWHLTEVHIDLPLGRVIMVVSAKWPALGGELLATLANPVLIAAAFADGDLSNSEVLISLLPCAPPAFGESGNWLGSSVARLILHAFETRCVERIRGETSRLPDVTKADPMGFSRAVLSEVIDIMNACRQRSDGSRLALEWLVHLVCATASSRSAPWADSRSNFVRSVPIQALTEAVAEVLRDTPLNEPQAVWDLFGGTSVDLNRCNEDLNAPESHLPRWDDSRGEADAISPIAVSALLIRDNERTSNCACQLRAWVRLAFMRLEDEPDLHLHRLVARSSGDLPRLLAWPLSKAPEPADALSLLWEDANWRRTRARFATLAGSAKLTQSCAAVVHLGMPILPDAGQAVKKVASRLSDMVDELRYTLPELGHGSWSEIVGTMAGVMAAHGLLKDSATCSAFLSRYVGDDDALASAVVNALANGASREDLVWGLCDNGEDPRELTERWMRWNYRLARDQQGGLSLFASRLAEIATPLGE